MRTTAKHVLACATGFAMAIHFPATAAPVLFKNAPSTTSLTNTDNWDGGALPGTGDVATWGAAVGGTSAGGALSYGSTSSPSYQGIDIQGALAVISITTGGTNPLTVGSAGITMASGGVNLTFDAMNLAVGANQSWSVGSGRTLTVGTNGGTLTLSNNLLTSGAVTIGGAGATTLTGSGVLEINGGTFTNNMQSGSSSSGRSGATTLTSGNLVISTSISMFGSGAINLNGGAIGSGTGTTRTMTNALNIGGNVAFGGAGFDNGGQLDFQGNTDLQGATRTLSSNITNTQGAKISGIVSNGGITVANSATGVLTLSGANTYTGPTTVNSGYLAVGLDALANSSSVALSGANTRLFVGVTGTTSIKNLSGSATANINTAFTISGVNGTRALAVSQTSDGTFAGTFTEGSSRPISLTKTGAATLFLTNDGVNYTGPTTVSNGKLQIGDGGATGTIGSSGAGAAGNVVTVSPGATLEFNRTGTLDYKTNARMRHVAGGGDIVITGGVKIFNYPGSTTGYNDANSWNNFTGTLTIKGGSEFQTIRNGATAMGTGTVVLGDATTSGKLSQIEGNWTWTNAIQSVGPANQITNNSTSSGRWNKLQGGLTGGGNVTINDSTGAMNNGDLGFIIAGASSMTGTITVDTFVRVGGNTTAANTGAGTVGDLGSAAVVINNGRRLTFSRSDALTVANTLSGGGSVQIGSAGISGSNTQTITLSGSNAHSGGTSVNAGRLRLGGASVLGTGTLTLAGGTVSSNGATARAIANPVSVAADSGLGDAADNGTLTLGTLSLAGAINSERTLTVSSPVLLNGVVTSASANAGLAKAGASTLTLTGAGNWSGSTTVSAGTFEVSGAGSIANSGSMTVTGGGTFTINTSGLVRTSGIQIPSGTVQLQAGTLRTNGISVNPGSAFTWGAATLTMRNANSGSSGSSDRTAIGGAASGPTVYEGTIITIDNGVGNTVATSSGSVLDLGGLYTSGVLRYDQLRVTGTLDLSAANDSVRLAFNPYLLRPTSPGSVFTGDWGTLILAHAETITGQFAQHLDIGNDAIGWTSLGVTTSPVNPATLNLNEYIIEYRTGYGPLAGGDAILFHYKVAGSVPEPASAGLLMAGALLLRAMRRRAVAVPA